MYDHGFTSNIWVFLLCFNLLFWKQCYSEYRHTDNWVTKLYFKIQHWKALSYISNCVFFQFQDCSNCQTIFFSGERPFICEMCGNSYTDIKNLKKHKTKVHTGEFLVQRNIKKLHQLFCLQCWMTFFFVVYPGLRLENKRFLDSSSF